MSTRSKWAERTSVTLLAILLFFSVVPITMMLSMSLRPSLQIYANFWGLPWPVDWANYSYALFSLIGPMLRTVYVSAMSIIGILFFSSVTGYAMARLDFVGKRLLYALIVTLLTVPGVLLLTPSFMLARWLHLQNSLSGLIVFYIGGGLIFAIFLLISFFKSQPEELFEAARIEGASEWVCIWKIAIPLSRPILVTIAIMNLLNIYNDLIWPLLMISKTSLQTLAIALANFNPTPAGSTSTVATFSRPEVGVIAAGYVFASIPLLLIFIFGMKYFIQGLTSGAVKS